MLLPGDYDVKMPDFTIDEGSYPATTKFSSSFWTRIWFLRIQLKGELASILQRQRVGITAMKIEITRTHFLSDIYSVVAVVLNTLLKMDLKLTYRLHGSGTNFWTDETFTCATRLHGTVQILSEIAVLFSTVYKSPYENLHGSPGPLKTKNAGCVQVFVRSKICPYPRVNLANSLWWLLVALEKKLIFHMLAFEFWFAWQTTQMFMRSLLLLISLLPDFTCIFKSFFFLFSRYWIYQ